MIHFALQKKLHTAGGEMRLHLECKIQEGELVGLYGPSGAGKTSVLRMLGGFMDPEEGFIISGSDTWYDRKNRINIPARNRGIGFVFQDYALFPNMNVRQNIEFALDKKDQRRMTAELLDLTGLTMLAERRTANISGGQKQRVALARAIAKKPSLLLLDEPLSAVDDETRRQLQAILLDVQKRYGLTTILVSHDMDEIVRLADKLFYLEQGQLQQYGTPAAFFLNGDRPSTLHGSIVSVEGGIISLLVSNRIVKIEVPGKTGEFKTGEKIEVAYNYSIPIIRKL